MIKVGFIDDVRFEEYIQDEGHPESPARVRAIRGALRAAGLAEKMELIPAREATREELLLVHGPDYLRQVEETCLGITPAVLGPDVIVNEGSLLAARLAAGSSIEAVAWALKGGQRRVFCNLRPPGHHALRDEAMGFCIFNNVALAARWALEKGGLERVAIVDWDVHHGNGTQEIFWNEPRVFYSSFHQFPFYPATGAGHHIGGPEALETKLNLPMPAGAGGKEYLKLLRERLVPALVDFGAELILISCGFDAHKDDPLADIRLDEEAYGEMTKKLVQASKGAAKGRIVSVLEGGYALKAIGDSSVAHVKALLEEGA